MRGLERFLHTIHSKKVNLSLEDKLLLEESKTSGFFSKGHVQVFGSSPYNFLLVLVDLELICSY